MDNIKPTEVIICFSSLPRWFEHVSNVDERKMGKSKESDKDHEKDPTGLNNVFTLEGE